jgi:hypothetical protein
MCFVTGVGGLIAATPCPSTFICWLQVMPVDGFRVQLVIAPLQVDIRQRWRMAVAVSSQKPGTMSPSAGTILPWRWMHACCCSDSLGVEFVWALLGAWH